MAKKAVKTEKSTKKVGKRSVPKKATRERAKHSGGLKPRNVRKVTKEVAAVIPEPSKVTAAEKREQLDEATHNSNTLDCFVNAPDRSNITNS